MPKMDLAKMSDLMRRWMKGEKGREKGRPQKRGKRAPPFAKRGEIPPKKGKARPPRTRKNGKGPFGREE